MPEQNFTVTIATDKTPTEVFEAINNVHGWWTGKPGVKGNSKRMGDEFTYRYENVHYSKQKVTELVPGKKIAWLVTDSQLNFIKDKEEWTGSQIVFEILEKDHGTEVRFTHIGLVQDKECFKDCSNAWSSYIGNSLKQFIAGSKLRAA